MMINDLKLQKFMFWFNFKFNPDRSLALTIFSRTFQNFAAHSLFNFLVAAKPHPIHPETGMILLHQIFVEADHYEQH